MLASQSQGFVFFFFSFTPVSLTLKTVLGPKKALYSIIYWITQCLFKRYVDLIMHSCLAVVVLGWRSMIFKNTAFFLLFSKSNLGFSFSSVGKESACNAGDLDSIPGLGRSPGEGNGNPLQYPCLENLMDRGAWWAAVHGVVKSWARLSE